MQNGLHCYLRKKRRLRKLATRKEVSMPWTLTRGRTTTTRCF